MKNILTRHKSFFLLSLIVVIGAFLRFYKLDWGQGLFAHPDEYHIVASVNQLSFPAQMHPHFFSYGTVTIYLIYFTKEVINNLLSIFNFQFSIFNSFLIGRFYSALSSTLTIIIVYKICRSLMERRFSYLAALLVALTPGLIQQAHFATPESALTFFLFLSLLLMLKFLKHKKTLYLVLASVVLGFAMGVKISSIVFLLPLIATIAFGTFPKHHLRGARSGHLGGGEATTSTPPRWMLEKAAFMIKGLLKFIGLALISAFIIVVTFRLVAPYVFFDYRSFRSNLDYEGALAIGKIPVFYTRQFIDTIPIVFQIEKIFPYALGPALLVFGIFGLFLMVYKHLGGGRTDSSEVNALLVVIIAFLSLFLPNAILFAKWTRFIAPTFPFFAIFVVVLLDYLALKTKRLSFVLGIVVISTTVFWSFAFFSIYLRNDIRIEASSWLEINTSPGSKFLVEGGNMVDLPLTGNFPKISLDFYNLEENPLVRGQIAEALYASGYFLVQSRRVFMNHQRLSHLYPKTAKLYDALFDGRLGFEQVKEFHSFPQLGLGNLKLEFPDESAEETWSVFDHPVIRVFKKEVKLAKEEYERIFENQ